MFKCFFTMLVLTLLALCCYVEGSELHNLMMIFRNNTNAHCGVQINCSDSESLPEAHYIVVDFLPLLVIFPLVMFFNLNLASGPKHSLLFFYQCVPIAIAFDYNPAQIYLYSGEFVWGIFTLHNILNIVYPNDNRIYSQPYLEIGLLKALLAIILIVVLVLMVRCTACPMQKCRYPWATCRRSMRKLRQNVTTHGSIVTGVCSLLLITYGFIIQQSFTALQLQTGDCCIANNGSIGICPRFCEDRPYSLSAQYIAVPTILLVLVLPIPLIFIYHPTIPTLVQRFTKVSLPRFTKQAPVMDQVQGVYKDKLSFFSGLNLLFLYVLWATFAFMSERPMRGFVLSAEFMVLLLLHSLCQPFRKHEHNYFHALFLLNLVAISTTTSTMVLLAEFDNRGGESSDWQEAFLIIMFTLTLLPLLCIILYYIKEWAVWGGNCIRRYTKKKKAAEPTWSNHSVANNSVANNTAKKSHEEKYLNLQESLLLSDSYATISVDTTIVEH